MNAVTPSFFRSSEGGLCATAFDAHKRDLVALFRDQELTFGQVARLMDVIVHNREAVARSANGLIAAE